MKHFIKPLLILLTVALLISSLTACGRQTETTEKDYASSVSLDMTSETKKQEVTVKTYIDGDTTHFNIPSDVISTGVLKARYLAINTPESTGKIEEYGKAASEFTKTKLSSATSIIIESDDENWNLDSTGGRYLVWVWYKTADSDVYRNLNIEILQNGLAIASSSANNRYGQTCVAAIAQAKALKLELYSGQNDPDFYYGEAIELTLKELRCGIENYNDKKVAFSGVITVNDNGGVYIEDYDAETDMYYGMYIYYGYGLSGEGLDILSVGNLSRIVGTVQYYEAGGTYQVSGLTYRLMKPDDPGNIRKLGDGYSPAYDEISAETFAHGKVTIESDDGTVGEFDYAKLAMSTSVSIGGLSVISVYTTKSGDSSSNGALTLTCEADGVTVTVRTAVLRDENGELLTESDFIGKVISVRGIVDYFGGAYQVKVFTTDNISVTD